MSDLTPAYCTWMRRVFELDALGKDTEALDLLYEKIDELLLAEEFEYVDGFLVKHPMCYGIDIIVGLLTITHAAKNKLDHRSTFYLLACGELIHRCGWDKAKEWLEGLE